MLYMICCSCGELLGNKQLIYETSMKKVCESLNVDFEMVSQGFTDNNEEFKKQRCDIVNKLCRRYCCKQLMITYIDLVNLIKG